MGFAVNAGISTANEEKAEHSSNIPQMLFRLSAF